MTDSDASRVNPPSAPSYVCCLCGDEVEANRHMCNVCEAPAQLPDEQCDVRPTQPKTQAVKIAIREVHALDDFLNGPVVLTKLATSPLPPGYASKRAMCRAIERRRGNKGRSKPGKAGLGRPL